MRRTYALLATLLLAGTILGCDAAPPPANSPSDAATEASPSDASSAQLLVLGRSVMTGWMAHWGGDPSAPTEWQGYSITFREIEGPPGIADSAVAAMADAPADSVVLFKFCFVDFNGGDYDNELDTYLDYVAEVADAAEARGVSLILGTALPKVAGETTLELVAEHREFGERLEEFAADRRGRGQDVVVLDLNAVLTDDDGALRDRYAISADDSHLTDAAYNALDDALLSLLDERR